MHTPFKPPAGVFRGGCRTAILLAVSLSLGGAAQALSPVDTVNNGPVVASGSYYNTAQGKTTFVNTGGGSLWVQSGSTVRGLEVDANGNLTNNGGTLHFYAPNSVVRIDGNVNVNGLLNGAGAYAGDGGKVFVDAAYLQQNGNIFANGVNGGLMQFNVGGLTLGPNARLQAQGFGGSGGMISVNANGVVDLQKGSKMDTSGQVPLSIDRNVINVEGALVNAEGVLRADGVQVGGVGSRGGVVRLVASGQNDLSGVQEALAANVAGGTPAFTPAEQTALNTRWTALDGAHNGDVVIGPRAFNGAGQPTAGWISVNGSSGPIAVNNDRTEDDTARAGDGGTLILAGQRYVDQGGLASVNGGNGSSGSSNATAGGNGGLIAITSNSLVHIRPGGVFQANGGQGGQLRLSAGSPRFNDPGARGGNGGAIAVAYNDAMINEGGIVAKGGAGAPGAVLGASSARLGRGGDGGNGGLIVLSGDANPTGEGQLNANGGAGGVGTQGNGAGGEAGVIVSPQPANLPVQQVAFQFQGGVNGALLGAARPLNQRTAHDEVLTHAENLVWLRQNAPIGGRTLTIRSAVENTTSGNRVRSVADPLGLGAARAETLAKTTSSGYPYRHFVVGSSVEKLILHMEGWNPLANLSSLTVVNDGDVLFPTGSPAWQLRAFGGSHASFLTSGNLEVNTRLDLAGNLAGGALHVGSLGSIFLNDGITTAVRTGIGVVGYHAGSITLKALQDIGTQGYLGIFTGTPLIGMTHRYQAGHDIRNGATIDADAGFGGLASSAATGGIIDLKAGNHFDNNPNGNTVLRISARSRGSQGIGGLIKIQAKTFDIPFEEALSVSGATRGTIVLRTLP